MTRRKREKVRRVSRLTNSRWSSWYTALVPRIPKNNSETDYEERQNGDGYIFKKIRTRFLEEKYDNGIYELSVSRKRRGKRGRGRRQVVYIGSSHRKGPSSIKERIMEYCTGGSHKDELINRAMRLGYTLLVRAQNIRGSRKHVWESENKYLAEYDYAWNERSNDRIRENFPPE